MEDKRLEALRQRLKWYIYSCPYNEYNEQEVNYILDQLRCDADFENDILSSYVSFVLNAKPKERKGYSKVIIASVAGVAIAASLFLLVFSQNKSIAGLRNGIFNYIKNDESGNKFFIFPDNIGTDIILTSQTYHYPEIPVEIMNGIWIPNEDIGAYELSSIDVYEDNRLFVHFHNEKNITLDFCYYASSAEIIDDTAIVTQLWYQNILVTGLKIFSDEETIRYRFLFEYNGKYYYMESEDIENVELLIHGFIDFLLDKL